MGEIELRELCGSAGAILSYAMAHKDIAKAETVSVQTVMMECYNVAHDRACWALREKIRPALEEAVSDYIMFNGERSAPFAGDVDDWESGFDDVIEDVVRPYQDVLTANWLGVNTIDVYVDDEKEREKWLAGFAGEIWKTLTYKHDGRKGGAPMPTEEVLDIIGIKRSDIEKALGARLAADGHDNIALTKPKKDYPVGNLYEAINRSIAHFNGELPADLADAIEFAIDDDEGLALGGFQRLGLDWQQDKGAIDAHCSASNGDAIETLTALWRAGPYDTGLDPADSNYDDGPAGDPATDETDEEREARELAELSGEVYVPPVRQSAPPAPVSPPAAPEVPKAPAPVPVPGSGGAVPTEVVGEVLGAIKGNFIIKDEELAEVLGVSRATINNLVNGKPGRTKLDNESRERLRLFIAGRIENVQNAMHKLFQ